MEKKKSKKKIIIISIVAVVLIGVVVAVVLLTGRKEMQLKTAVLKSGTVQTSVTATGYVQPVDKVEVGTQVSGVIEKIYVDYNSQVKKGQLLAELDKLTLNEKLKQANASLSSAKSDLQLSQLNYDRVKKMYDAKAATEASFEEAQNKLIQAKTSLANANANLHQAKVNLSYAEIYSPIDGVVLNRAVEEGQTVAASFSTPTLFTIANDLTKMQVEADVDEADIGKVKLGQRVTFYVDAFSDDVFEGTVSQIRLEPTVTSNVVTYTVIVEAPNPEEKLYPGMTANITIITQEEEGVMILASAMNFTPSDDVMKEYNIQPPSQGEKGSRKPSGEMPPADRQSSGKDKPKMVWVKENGTLAPKRIETGLSDGVYVVATSGLKEGDEVVLSAAWEKKTTKKQGAAANPLMPSRLGGNSGRR
jgi:HlyD family secretion protein